MPPDALSTLLFAAELIGVVAFAAAGALRSMERRMDVFGVMVLAVITALGGGFIRDILVNRFPASLAQPVYFYTALAGGALTLLLGPLVQRYPLWLKLFDALGLAVFSILGAQVGIDRGLNGLTVTLLGLLTGIGGGVLRDLLANDVPLVLRQEVYALASLLGIGVLLAVDYVRLPSAIGIIAGVLVTLLIRLAAIRWNLNLPRLYHA